MLTTNPIFDAKADSDVRQITYGFRAAFDKTYDDNITFFTLDTSVLDGPDILQPMDNEVIQAWDKYEYTDYTKDIISLEYTREEDFPSSVVEAIATIRLENTDGFYTPGGGSAIGPYILPKRPIRLLTGFSGQNLPQFNGITDKMPKVDYVDKTAEFNARDFLSYVFDQELGSDVILENQRTDQILDYIFQLAGLLPAQYVLDHANNTIPFTYFESSELIGNICRTLVEAELGRLFMDELGVIRFYTSDRINDTPVYTLDASKIINIVHSQDDKIINLVDVTSEVREVQSNQLVYELSTSQDNPIIVKAGETAEYFFNFEDPVTNIDTIDSYIFNANSDGSGADLTVYVNITNVYLFAKAVKITFDNTGTNNAYLTAMQVYGTPALVVRTIRYTASDNDSIADFGVVKYEIDNGYVQTNENAEAIAETIVNYYGTYGSVIEVQTKGNPALQIGDCIYVDLDNYTGNYNIIKTVDIYDDGSYTQRLTMRKARTANWFIIDTSVLDGTDVLDIR